jgi:hypothetical protein
MKQAYGSGRLTNLRPMYLSTRLRNAWLHARGYAACASRTFEASALSRKRSAPPPSAVAVLIGPKLSIEQSARASPRGVGESNVCAQSSHSRSPRSRDTRAMSSRLLRVPKRCATSTARVAGVTSRSMSAAVGASVAGSTSTGIARSPCSSSSVHMSGIVSAETITSLPFGSASSRSIRSKPLRSERNAIASRPSAESRDSMSCASFAAPRDATAPTAPAARSLHPMSRRLRAYTRPASFTKRA